jgi:uncharacterized protein involved in outer membrane biogenesis
MKKLKKVLLVFGILLVVLIASAFVLPIFFKDEIKAEVDKQIVKYVNADVQYKADDFGLSLFRNFPHLTVSLDNFAVLNRQPFKGDTLASFKSFRAKIDLWSVLFGKEMKINGISLISPRISAKVNKAGQANWDIYIPQPPDTTKKEPEKPSKLKLAIEEWKIENAFVVYDDKTLPAYAKIENFNHKGSGKLDADIFDLFTKTEIGKITAEYGGTNYLNEKKFEADVTLGMDMKNSKYTFKDNTFKLNDFTLKFDGFVAMPDTNINMDIKFLTPETNFKDLLSLVPGIYTNSFKDINTEGKMSFNGDAKGTYNAKQLPAFHLNLKVDNAKFQYPKLPAPVENINVDLGIACEKGIIDEININLRKFHLDLAKNPVDAKATIEGLTNMKVDADVKAKLNLADVIKIFPIDGLNLAGLFSIDAQAKGIYNATQMPVVNAQMALQNGYIKSNQFPAPLEKINLNALAKSDGTLPNSEFGLQNFSMVLENEPFTATAFVKNFQDIAFDVKVKGGIDLTKITKIYPLEGMKLAGRVQADIASAGKMSDIKASRYEKVPTSGTMKVTDFVYETKDMPLVKITKAAMIFNPEEMILQEFNGFAGKSDMDARGNLSNYMSYLFQKGVLQGKLDFKSQKFDVNEWISNSPTPTKPEQEVPLSVIEVPKNIDFAMNSSIGKVIYSNMTLDNVNGNIIVKDGKIRLDKVAFNTLGGEITANGTYDTQDIKKPKFDFDFGVKDMLIQEAAKTFITVATFAPIAKDMLGKFSTKFKLSGDLKQDFMPVMNSLTGGGIITIAEGTLKNVPALAKIIEITKLGNLNPLQMLNVLLEGEVKNGRFIVKPFDLKAGDYNINIEGSNGADGSLAYNLKMDVPTGQAGQQASSYLSQIAGTNVASLDKVPLNIAVGGLYNKPTVKIAKGEGGLKASVKGVVDAEKEKLKKQLENELDQKKKEAQDKVKAETDRMKAEAEAKIKLETDKIKADLEAKAKKELQDKAKKELEDKIKAEKDKLKGKLPITLPKFP